MIKRKKILSTITIISLMSMFMVGCNSQDRYLEEYNMSTLKAKDISEVKMDEENFYAYKTKSFSNTEEVNPYDKVRIESYNVKGFDKETSEYKVSIEVKNISKDKISNIIGRLDVQGEYGGFGQEDNIKIDTLNPNESKFVDVNLQQYELASCVASTVDENGDDIKIDYKKAIKDGVEKKLFEGGFTYTYNNLDKEIYQQLGFDGEVMSKQLTIEDDITLEEFNKSKTYHVDNGSYLNIVNNDKKQNELELISLKNIELKLDIYQGISINMKLKNESENEVKGFYINPALMISNNEVSLENAEYNTEDGYFYNLNELLEFYEDKTITPQEEINIKISLYSIPLDLETIDNLRLNNSIDMKSTKQLFVQLIENRLVSFATNYSYSLNDEIEEDISVFYAANGKMQEYIYNKFNYDSLPTLEIGDDGDIIES